MVNGDRLTRETEALTGTIDELHRCAITDHEGLLEYDFGAYHPLRPERISAGLDLLETGGLWDRETEILRPSPATTAELELVHDPAYVRAVDWYDSGGLPGGMLASHGFASADNPPFPGMHQAASLVAGASVCGLREIMTGRFNHVFNPAGGLHHALAARTAGFCIYNDPAVAAAVAITEYDARVFYVDFDCHHGDGVQWIFYGDPRVFTLSLHESGKYLFPGTGEVSERGEGPGLGTCLNVPFAPYTRDASWKQALHALLPDLAERFRPEIIISNHGCDTHHWDPLTHLSLTTESLMAQARLVHQLAHEFCDGRWLAVGSGGYDWRRVVPRSWAILWAEMTGRSLPEYLPEAWRSRWETDGEEWPLQFLDGPDIVRLESHVADIEAFNASTLRTVLAAAG